ncbi:hypothetical protein [Oceanobacter kriegii]|uniref:hypothetical protein n=1 Tax=Oceanobacter kriegii TaxID=64972 RepID=UPI0012EB3400|nr:hypothetical protein [Oceanobacter kriegii]
MLRMVLNSCRGVVVGFSAQPACCYFHRAAQMAGVEKLTNFLRRKSYLILQNVTKPCRIFGDLTQPSSRSTPSMPMKQGLTAFSASISALEQSVSAVINVIKLTTFS